VPDFKVPGAVGDQEKWESFLAKTANFFYECGATDNVDIAARGERFYNWTISLYQGNDPKWLEPHLMGLLERIRKARSRKGYDGPNSLTVLAPEYDPIKVSAE